MSAALNRAKLRQCRTQLGLLIKACRGDESEVVYEAGQCPFKDASVRFYTDLTSFENTMEGVRAARAGDRQQLNSEMTAAYHLLMGCDETLATMRSFITEMEARANQFSLNGKMNKYRREVAAIAEFKTQLREAEQAKARSWGVLEIECDLQRSFLARLRERVPGFRTGVKSGTQNPHADPTNLPFVIANARQLLEASRECATELERIPYDGPPLDLYTAPETKMKMAVVQGQKKQIAEGLKKLSKTLDLIAQQQRDIRAGLVSTTDAMESLAGIMHSQMERVQRVDELQKKWLEEQSPCQFCLTCFCSCIILAILGYLLYRFDVIKV